MTSKRLWMSVTAAIMAIGGATVILHKEGKAFEERFNQLDGRHLSADLVIRTQTKPKHFFYQDIAVSIENHGQTVLDLAGKATFGWGVTLTLNETPESPLASLMKAREALDGFNTAVKVKASPLGRHIKVQLAIDPMHYTHGALGCDIAASTLDVQLSKVATQLFYSTPSLVCQVHGDTVTFKQVALQTETQMAQGTVANAGSIEVKAGPVSGRLEGLGPWTLKSLAVQKTLDFIEGSSKKHPLYLSHITWKLHDFDVPNRGSIAAINGDVYIDRFPGEWLDATLRRPVDDPRNVAILRKAYHTGGMNIIVKNIDLTSRGNASFINGTLRAQNEGGQSVNAGVFYLSINPKSWKGFPELQENLEALASIGTLFYKEGIYSAEVNVGGKGIFMNGKRLE